MKLAGIAFIAGIVMTAAGMVILLMGEDIELKGGDALVIPEGADSYAYLQVDMGTGGPIEGSFECAEGSSVRLSVMDEGQFDSFVDGLGDDSRTTVADESGEFSVEQVDMETCYIVLRHFPGIEVEQTVDVEYTVLNTDFGMFLASVGLIVGGGVVWWLAMYSHQKMRAKERASVRKYTDVVFFDK